MRRGRIVMLAWLVSCIGCSRSEPATGVGEGAPASEPALAPGIEENPASETASARGIEETEIVVPELDVFDVIAARGRDSSHPLIRGTASVDGKSILAPERSYETGSLDPSVARLLPLFDRAGFPEAGTSERVVMLLESEEKGRSPIELAMAEHWLVVGDPLITLRDDGLTSLSHHRDSNRLGSILEKPTAIDYVRKLEARLEFAETLGKDSDRPRALILRKLTPSGTDFIIYWVQQVREAVARGKPELAARAAALVSELGCDSGKKDCELEANLSTELATRLWIEARDLLVSGGDRRDALILLARAEALAGEAWKRGPETLALRRAIERETYFASADPATIARVDPLVMALDEIANSPDFSKKLDSICVWDNIPRLISRIEDRTPMRRLAPQVFRRSWHPMNLGDVVLECLEKLAERDFEAELVAVVEKREPPAKGETFDRHAELRKLVEKWWRENSGLSPSERALADFDQVPPHEKAAVARRALASASDPAPVWDALFERSADLEERSVRHEIAIVLLGLDGSPEIAERARPFATVLLEDASLGARTAGAYYLWTRHKDPKGLRVIERALADGSARRAEEPNGPQEFVTDDILALLWRSGEAQAEESFRAAVGGVDALWLRHALTQGCFDKCELTREQEALAVRAIAGVVDGLDDPPVDLGQLAGVLCDLEVVRGSTEARCVKDVLRNRTHGELVVLGLVNRGLAAMGEAPRRRPELEPPSKPAPSGDHVVRTAAGSRDPDTRSTVDAWLASWQGKGLTRLDDLFVSFVELARTDRAHAFRLRVLRFEGKRGVALLVSVGEPHSRVVEGTPFKWSASANCDQDDACGRVYSSTSSRGDEDPAKVIAEAKPILDRWRAHPEGEAIEEYELAIRWQGDR